MIGGDLGQMQQLEGQLTRASEEVRTLQNTVTNGVLSTQWTGPASNRFREAWNGQYKNNLVQLQDALTQLSTEVKNRRVSLENASA
jgi:WXG100 family type VII secretion target